MKRHWDEQELAEHWSLTHAEFELLRNRTDRSRFGFAALLKFFQVEGRFPSSSQEVPTAALDYLADQLGLSRDGFAEYDLSGRSGERDRAQIRSLVGFRRVVLQPQEFHAPVFGPPGLGVRLPGDLVPTHVVIHQRRRPRQPQLRLLQRRLQQPHRPVQRQLRRFFWSRLCTSVTNRWARPTSVMWWCHPTHDRVSYCVIPR